MIFFISAALTAAATIYLLSGTWIKEGYRFAFGVTSFLITAMLILFGTGFEIETKQPVTERRVIVFGVDVSSSTGLKTETVKNILAGKFPDYNLEILPFSDSLLGPEEMQSTALIESVNDLLSYVSDNYEDDKVAGIALISDGNETEKVEDLKNEINPRGDFPHNALYLKKDGSSADFDKSVAFINVPRFMPLYTQKRISFAVNLTGADLNAVPVELKLDGKILGSVLVPIDDGYGTGEFDLVIKETENFLLEASVAPDSREEILSNNRDYAPVEGIIKGFRVLHISGHPSTDTSFIRRGLQNIPGVDMISFYILRTHRQLSDTPQSELSLIPFPTDQLFRKELDNFDLIIINDFLLSEFLIPVYINNISRFVRSGGGLLIFGGVQSYLAKDILVTEFGEVLPVKPTFQKNWDNNATYRVLPLDICRLTMLEDLYRIRGISFNGLNRVELKDSANLLCSASDGSPLIAGMYAGKGRVISVMTDSFWHASYYGGIDNETLLKSMVRYILGISKTPVKIYTDRVAFDKGMLASSIKGLTAELTFIDPQSDVLKKHTITPSSYYSLTDNDSRLIEVKIFNEGKLLDDYKLVNFNEKRDNEHAYLPAGKSFLQNIADAGGGEFIMTDAGNIQKALAEISLREPVLVSEKKQASIPLYKHRGILVLLLMLGILSFYIKSRFYD